MPAIDTIIAQIESEWKIVAERGILQTISHSRLSDVYVAGFWLFYVDYTEFYPPYLSINSKSLLTSDDYKWAPPEWEHGLDEAPDSLSSIYEPLVDELKGSSEADWDVAIELHYEAISRVSQHLTKKLQPQSSEGFTSDFLACILDHQHGYPESERLARMSLGGALPSELEVFYNQTGS